MKAKELIGILAKNPENEVLVIGWYFNGQPAFSQITNDHVKSGESYIFIGAEPLDPLVSKLMEKPVEQPKIEDGPDETEN